MKSLWYQARVTWSWAMALPALILAFYGIYGIPNPRWFPEEDFTPYVLPLFEAILPLAAILLLPKLTAGESEAKRMELLCSLPRPRWAHLLCGLTAALILLALSTIPITLWFYQVAQIDIAFLVSRSISPLLALSGAALFVSTLTNNTVSGYMAAGGWWFFDILTQGEYSGRLFLFAASMPREGLDLGQNRLLLTGIGFALLAAALVVLERKEKM